jgi:hypothetical protein
MIAAQITITEPPLFKISSMVPSLYPNGKNLSCNTCSNGSITVNTTGGVGTLSYLWETGPTTQTISNQQAGTYFVTVTDLNGCTASSSKSLVAPERDDWSMFGNANVIPDSQFIGTKDNKDFVLRTNNIERMRLKQNGDVKISGMTGSATRMMLINDDGVIIPGDPFDPGPVSPLCNWHLTNPWHRANTTGPTGAFDVLNCDQRFGFGIIAPQEKIHVNGFARFSSLQSAGNYINIGHDGNSKINSYGTGELKINDNSSQNISLCKGGGIVTIGEVTPQGSYRLFVRDGIRTESIKVDVAYLNSWSDYVFQSDYKLLKLSDLAQYIQKHKHLPGIPSAEEVVKNGLDLAEMDAKLLAKIEELTLYLLEQKKEIDALKMKLEMNSKEKSKQ